MTDEQIILVQDENRISSDSRVACIECHNPLSGCRLDGVCGNCQAPVSASISTSAAIVPVDVRGLIACTWPCHGCGYDLRGLNPAGNCPECERSIRQSLCTQGMDRSPTTWLRRAGIGLCLLVIYYIASGMSTIIDRSIRLAQGSVKTSHAAAVWMYTVPWIATVMVFYFGVWNLTTPAPRHSPLSADNRLRRILRVAMWASLIFSGISIPPYIMYSFSSGSVSYSRWVIECICSLLALTYAARVAKAIPARKVERLLVLCISLKIIIFVVVENTYATTAHWMYAFGSGEFPHQTLLSHATGVFDISLYRPAVYSNYIMVGVEVLLDFWIAYLFYRMHVALRGSEAYAA